MFKDPVFAIQYQSMKVNSEETTDIKLANDYLHDASIAAKAFNNEEPRPSDELKSFDRNLKPFVNTISAVIIWKNNIINAETILAMSIAAGATLICWYFSTSSSNMSWTLVSVALVFPLVYSIGQAFRRREEALDDMADMKALICNQFIGLIGWDFAAAGIIAKAPWGGRDHMPENFKDIMFSSVIALVDTMEEYFGLPNASRGRNFVMAEGIQFRQKVANHRRFHSNNFTRHMMRISRGIEALKARGMPGNEAARLNQYLWLMQSKLERLKRVKDYRTPQAVRSFARVYILILPIFYAPYFAYVAGDSNSSGGTGIIFATLLSILTSAVMMALFNVEHALEDPFDERGLDAIHFKAEFQDLKHMLSLIKVKEQQTLNSHCVIFSGEKKEPAPEILDGNKEKIVSIV